MKCRFIHEVSARVITNQWEAGVCPGRHFHTSLKVVEDVVSYAEACAVMALRQIFDDPTQWPTKCDHCDHVFVDAHRSTAPERIYDTASGHPEPGDLFYEPCTSSEVGGACYHWNDCTGKHLHAVLPTGEEWDIDSRASNCTMPENRLHRCWVRTGEPPNVTAGKIGPTCAAGVGSIQTSNYHGMLIAGEFNP